MVHHFNLCQWSVAVMTLLNIAFLMVGWAFSIVYFYTMGVNSGYIEGRKALRKHYEQRDKVRA
jgi:hypothetical protein